MGPKGRPRLSAPVPYCRTTVQVPTLVGGQRVPFLLRVINHRRPEQRHLGRAARGAAHLDGAGPGVQRQHVLLLAMSAAEARDTSGPPGASSPPPSINHSN